MLLTPFSYIWVFQILIGYSKFLRNAYLHILLFSFGYFCRCKTFHDFTVGLDTFTPVCFDFNSDFIWDFGKLPFPKHLGKYFITRGPEGPEALT